LKYAGKEDEAETVGIGNNNSSETQSCKVYEHINVPLKKHSIHLRSKPRERNVRPSLGLRNDDIILHEEIQRDPASSVTLNLIDTPGLSDSGNDREGGGGSMSIVDERHKLGILIALSKVTAIHAVCFVVNRHEAFGNSFQGHIQDLIRLFNLSFPKGAINYHVIHTWITLRERFPDDDSDDEDENTEPDNSFLLTREAVFNEHIRLNPSPKHHFIDSTPPPHDKLGIYFQNHVLAEIFQPFSTASGAPTTDITYPRSDAHVLNDAGLQNAFRVVKSQILEQQNVSNKLKAEFENDKKPFIELLAEYENQKTEVQKQIARYDTMEHVRVGGCSESVETSFLQFSMIWKRLSFNSSTKISKVEKDCTNGKFDAEVQTEKTYRVDLNTINYSRAYGTVNVYSYKRDVEAAMIRKLRAEIKEIEETMEIPRKKLAELNNEIKECRKNYGEMRKGIEELDQEMAKMGYEQDRAFDPTSPPSFSVAEFGDMLRYFTVDNLNAAATGYKLEIKIDKDYLPKNDLDEEELYDEMDSMIEKEAGLKKRSGEMKDKHVANIERDTNCMSGYDTLLDAIEKLFAGVQSVLDGSMTCIVPLRNLAGISKDDEEELVNEKFSNATYKYKGKAQDVLRFLSNIDIYDEINLETLQAHAERLFEMRNELRNYIEAMNKELMDLTEIFERSSRMFRALSEAQAMIREERLEIGAFAVVLKAINDGVMNPYMRLAEEICCTLAVEELMM
jgi:prefoldin subunit 5